MQTTTPENGKGRRATNTPTPMQTGADATARRQRRQASRLPVIEAPSQERIAAMHAIRDNNLGQSGKQQCARLLAALQQLGLISTYEASRYLDLYDPRARKMDLRDAGHPVEKMWILTPTESGDLHRIGAYYLDRLGTKRFPGSEPDAPGTPITHGSPKPVAPMGSAA